MKNLLQSRKWKDGSRRFWRYTKAHPMFALGLLVVLVNLLLMVLAPYITPYPPEAADPFNVRQAPSMQHLFGTDPAGMDVFSRVIYAPRIDLTIALAGIGLSLVAGVFLGAVAGYWKNWLTEGIQRICDLLQAFPPFVLAMALVAVTGQKIENVIYVIAFLNIPIYMRLVRSEVMSVKDRTFIEAAVCSGGSGMRVLLSHVLPNVVGSALTQASVNIGWAILLTSGLSFIGAGVPVPTPEWGAMIAVGAPTIITGEWWSSLFPGMAIAVTALGFSLTGDGLQEFLDPTRRS